LDVESASSRELVSYAPVLRASDSGSGVDYYNYNEAADGASVGVVNAKLTYGPYGVPVYSVPDDVGGAVTSEINNEFTVPERQSRSGSRHDSNYEGGLTGRPAFEGERSASAIQKTPSVSAGSVVPPKWATPETSTRTADNKYNTAVGKASVNIVTSIKSPTLKDLGYPILLDLDGDGLELTPLSSSNSFIVGEDGKQHRTAWAGVGDGILVRDDGNDGVINQNREVIFTEWDPTAKSDFEALRNVFDTNHDGVLSSADADWSLFKVLVTRPDGSTELKTLAELGITSINLISNQQEINFADGSKISGTATYTKSDGSTGKVGDVSLAMDARIGTRPLAGWSVAPTICGRRRVRTPDEAPGRIRSASRLRREVELPVQAEREQSARALSGKVA
jgi:hypothetical protein